MKLTPENANRDESGMTPLKRRRLERRLAAVRLKLARESARSVAGDTEASLDTLRAGLEASERLTGEDGRVIAEAPMYRERRLSAEALLGHHVAVAKLAERDAPGTVNIDARQQTAITVDREALDAMLKNPQTRDAAMRLVEASEGVETPGGDD